jgi:hypothetical protein
MKLTIGMPIVNAIDCCERSINCIITSMKINNYDFNFNIIDDNSNEETKDRLSEICKTHDINLYHTEDYITSVNPNLAWNVNFLLNKVNPEDDYYLNLESDVYVEQDTIPKLIQGIKGRENKICAVHPMLYHEGINAINWAGGGFMPPIQPDFLKSQYVQLTPFSCLLVLGEYARNPQIRVDERLRLWYCDYDFSMQIQKITGKKIWYTCLSKAIHLCNGSSKGIANWEGVLTYNEAGILFAQKWGVVK